MISEFPAFILLLNEGPEQIALAGGCARFRFLVRLLERPSGDFTQEWQILEEYLEPSGPRSVMGVIDADPTLDNSVDTATVLQTTEITKMQLDEEGPVYPGADFLIDCWATIS